MTSALEPLLMEEPPAQRPWPVEVLMYPLSVSGIVHVLILAFLGAQLRPTLSFNYWRWGPPAFHFVFLVVLGAYCLFYLIACIRESADGGTKPPDVNQLPEELTADAIIGKLGAMVIWVAFCLGPAVAYAFLTKRIDWGFWALLAGAIVYAPMALLAVAMFDSVRALNPILILPSILSTLIPYLLFVVGLGTVSALMVLLYCLSGFTSILWAYLMLMIAQALGRFYLRFEDRLNW